MVKDIRYIIKRVISAILIALCLYFLKNYLLLSVRAMSVVSETMGFQNSNTVIVSNLDSSVAFDLTGGYFGYYNGTSGYIRFPISINKVSGSNTSSVVLVHGVAVTIGNNNYLCEVGNNTIGNSTYNGSAYSVKCPVNMVTAGMSKIYVVLDPFQSNDYAQYSIKVGSGASYEIVEGTNVQVNVDTNGIINNQNSNTQDIIDNQTQNTQDMIESQQVCDNYSESYTMQNSGFEYGWINGSGVLQDTSNHSYMTSDYISVMSNKTYTIQNNYSNPSGWRYCLYDSNKTLLSCLSFSTSTFTGANYIRFSFQSSTSIVILGENCKGGNQAIYDAQKDINNTLNDTSSVGSSDITSFFGDIDESSDTPISDLITMPLTLLTAYSSGFSGTCSNWNLGNLYGTNLVMPCIHVSDYLGNDLWHLIDLCFSLYMIYNLAMLGVMIFEDITSLRDDMLSLYTPQHAYTGYQPRHGSD